MQPGCALPPRVQPPAQTGGRIAAGQHKFSDQQMRQAVDEPGAYVDDVGGGLRLWPSKPAGRRGSCPPSPLWPLIRGSASRSRSTTSPTEGECAALNVYTIMYTLDMLIET